MSEERILVQRGPGYDFIPRFEIESVVLNVMAGDAGQKIIGARAWNILNDDTFVENVRKLVGFICDPLYGRHLVDAAGDCCCGVCESLVRVRAHLGDE